MHQQQQQQHPHYHQPYHAPQQQKPPNEDAMSVSSTMHCHTNAAYSDAAIIAHCHQSHTQQQQQQQQRKHSHSHSHSPHSHSRHTSPHSHHSHSQHTSPHQSQPHMHDYESASPLRAHARQTIAPAGAGAGAGANVGHQHHHHHRRRRRQHSHHHHGGSRSGSAGGSGSLPGAHSQRSQHIANRHGGSCARRHRSVTDVSSASINVCHDPACADREVQEILVRKPCCSSSSRTELAQYFAEDLYGTSSRRPSSCCTSSDYCYQTDSTSLYGSRSSLSRNNSIKSASAAMRKQQRLHQRQPSYTSISLRGLNASRPNSQLGSLTSIFDRAKQIADEAKEHDPVAKGSTLERQSSKDAVSKEELPEYACSPSPIRWSFLADAKSPTEFEGGAAGSGSIAAAAAASTAGAEDKTDAWQVCDSKKKSSSKQRDGRAHESIASWKSAYDDGPSTSAAAAAAAAARKRRSSSLHCEFEESTTVLFHQEGEAYNNCCNNYIQCNTYLDQDLQITSEDIHQYLSKGNQQAGDILNNSKNYPFQPSNALEFQYKNNFAANNNNNNNNNTNTTNTASSDAGEYFQRYERSCRRNSSKETNLNQNAGASGPSGSSSAGAGGSTQPGGTSSCSSTPLSPTNINLSSSTNNINIVFSSCLERNANEVKFINTAARDSRDQVVSSEAHHSGYLPYTYPTYDYTNMAGNSQFDKPIGIDELSKEFGAAIGGIGGASTTSEHSSSLQSPVQIGVSFESFDAASEHHLLSQRSSYQYSPTSRTPISPASPSSASINPSGDAYVPLHQTHYDYEQQAQQLQQYSPCSGSSCSRRQHQSHQSRSHHQPHQHEHYHAQHSSHQHCHQQYDHDHDHHHHHHEFEHDVHATPDNSGEYSKLGNAFKKVRKRARKYTDFLRKK